MRLSASADRIRRTPEQQRVNLTSPLVRNGPNVETILSYNYDTVLELVMRMANLGKVYGWSQQNPIIGPGLTHPPAEIYWDEKKNDRRVIHIAKPHGSSNFAGWARREISDSTGKRPLYPIEGAVVLRDNTLRILEGPEVHSAVSAADLVLPGEWTCWAGTESTRVEWAVKHKDFFVDESKQARRLLLVGFGYGEPDQPEFDEILGRIGGFQEVHIVHPECRPPEELLRALESVSSQEIKVWSEPPS